MRRRAAALLIVCLVTVFGWRASAAQASDPDEASDPTERGAAEASEGSAATDPFRDEAPSIDAPRMRTVEPRTRIYADATVARSKDLSALPAIAGQARGARVSIGGSLRVSRFQFDLELPAFQVTRLDLLDWNPATPIDDRDRVQTSYALGDSRLGAQWTERLPIDALAVVAGFGVGARIPTHTGRFTFHLVDGTEDFYVLPYYFHVQPALLLGAAWGPLTFVMNQGALVLVGPDGEISNIPFVTPTIYFWDAHYALSVRVGETFSLSVAAATTVQLNELDRVMFPHLNHVKSVFVIPGVAAHVGAYRIDLVARFGVTAGAEPIGVITYSGHDSIVLRVTRNLD